MVTQTKTSIIVAASILFLGLYDIYAILFGGEDASISRFMQNAGLRQPYIVLVVGFIAGHIFGYMKPTSTKKIEMTNKAMISTGIVITTGVYDIIAVTMGKDGSAISSMIKNTQLDHPILLLIFGIICGHVIGYMRPVKTNKT